MQNAIESELVAAASILDTGAIVIARGLTYSAAQHVIDGAGVYGLTLDRAIDALECVIVVTPRTHADVAASVVHTSDTVKTVNIRTIAAAPAAHEAPFDVKVYRISGGVGR